MKKGLAIILAAIMATGGISVVSAGAAQAEDATGSPGSFASGAALYVHAVSGSDDTEAWQAWQSVHDEEFNEYNTSEKYFFLPTSAGGSQVDVYNAFPGNVTVGGVTIAPGETKAVPYNTNQNYSVSAGGRTYTLKYMKSNAEAAIYINNPNADGNGTDLMSYLNATKSNSASATGAIVTPEGSIDNTAVKKIKGRGNTTWGKPKKAYNITYDKKVSIAGMEKNKKYSILANYQDDSLARNRILYDLSDAVGVPYASDSRFVDFYVNGYYWGSYQMTEKIEGGSLVTNVTGDEYLESDGVTVKSDFPFVAEVDASAGAEDYYVTCDGGIKVTIKVPEIDPGDPGYDEVKAYVQNKYNNLLNTSRNAIYYPNTSLANILDLDSAAKLYLINELGKNWDAGVSSTFFTYKQDANGRYKFFGSPVWDYDNSLGNAVGVGYDLNNMGVNDYQQYTGWWCRFKGKSANENLSYNIMNLLSRNQQVQSTATQVWFDEFMPAINHFSGKTTNAAVDNEMYSAEKYFSLLSDSAEMNYRSGWLLNTGSWIAPHNSLRKANFNFFTGAYTTASSNTSYPQNHGGMFDYAADWMVSRAAWLSNQMYSSYTGSKVKYDIDRDGAFTISDITALQRYLAEFDELNALQQELANADGRSALDVNDVTFLQREKAGLFPGGGGPDGTVKVTFVNTLDWSGTINVFFWGSSQQTTTWPGEQMTQIADIDGHDAYTFYVPNDASHVIFDNGNFEGAIQTVDIPFDGASHTYRILNQTNELGRYYAEIDGAGSDAPDGTAKVTFVNTLDWSGSIYVYFWGSTQTTTVWPGEQMTQIADIDGHDAYTFYVPDDASNVIFDNGVGDGVVQTENIAFDGTAHTYRPNGQMSDRGRYYVNIG